MLYIYICYHNNITLNTSFTMRHRIGFLTDLTEYSLINSVSVFLVVLVVDGSLVK